MIELAEPSPQGLVEALTKVIPMVGRSDYTYFNKKIKSLYNWKDVSLRTEKVYQNIIERPPLSLLDRLKFYRATGTIFGLIAGKLFHLFISRKS